MSRIVMQQAKHKCVVVGQEFRQWPLMGGYLPDRFRVSAGGKQPFGTKLVRQYGLSYQTGAACLP